MAPELADRILVWTLSDADAYTLESCDWFNPHALGSLRSLSDFIHTQLDAFYGAYSEYFNLAEYPDVAEQLQPTEITIFRSAAGVPEDAPSDSIADYGTYHGLRTVILRRLELGTLKGMQLAADLFNWTIDFGLFLSETDAQGVIRVGPVGRVAPFVLERILSRFDRAAWSTNDALPMLRSDFERNLVPVIPVLQMLSETVESADWTRNDLALKMFCWIVDLYKHELEREGY